jgi:hypothetical protein
MKGEHTLTLLAKRCQAEADKGRRSIECSMVDKSTTDQNVIKEEMSKLTYSYPQYDITMEISQRSNGYTLSSIYMLAK